MKKDTQVELQNLKNALASAESRVRTIEREIEDIEIRKVLPKIKKKYEGKYYVYLNSYGRDQQWKLYVYVNKVIGINEFECYTFQTEHYGKTDIEIKNRSGEYLLQKQITRTQYMIAFKRMRAVTDFAFRIKSLTPANH